MGTGINVSMADGTSLGVYGEVGYRVGGTGFGAGATVSQSLDYNFDKKEVSTTTAAGAYASLGAGNASVGGSYNHQSGRFDWSATVGVGMGSNKAGAGMGFSVGYGSQGIIWGVGGWGRGPANAMADKRAQRAAAKTAQNASGVRKYIIFGTDAEKQAVRKYIDGSSSLPNAEVKKGLAAMGYTVSKGEGGYLEVVKYTKSNLQMGQQMHKAYKVGADGIKEFRLPSGKRIDFLDIKNGTIYELKPYNPRAMQQGQRQLNMYMQELQTMPQFKGINWKTVLDTY